MDWIKSSFCGSSACVEVATDEEVHVRDSAGTVVAFDRRAWQAFIEQVRR